jgi:hypothetical protein
MDVKQEVTELVMHVWDCLVEQYYDNPDWSMRPKREVFVRLMKDSEELEREFNGDFNGNNTDFIIKEWLLDTDMGNWRV